MISLVIFELFQYQALNDSQAHRSPATLQKLNHRICFSTICSFLSECLRTAASI